MSSYDRFERRSQTTRRSAFSHWLPLILTVTVATIGLATWVWSERREDDEDTPDYGKDDNGNARGGPPVHGDLREGDTGDGTTTRQPEESSSYMARMSGALKRTPSPQQVFDGASRTVVGGLAAAGAVVGNALSSIREEVKDPYADHRTWSEEAELRKAGVKDAEERTKASSTSQAKGESSQRAPVLQNTRKKTVAIVVSAASGHGAFDDDEDYQHAVSYMNHYVGGLS